MDTRGEPLAHHAKQDNTHHRARAYDRWRSDTIFSRGGNDAAEEARLESILRVQRARARLRQRRRRYRAPDGASSRVMIGTCPAIDHYSTERLQLVDSLWKNPREVRRCRSIYQEC